MSLVIGSPRTVPSTRQKRCGMPQSIDASIVARSSMDVLSAAVGCVPVPGLSAAFAAFQFIVQAVETVQSNKEELVVMRECIRVLLRAVNLQYIEKKLKVSSTRTAIADLTALLNEIAAFVKKQTSQNFFKHLFNKDALRARIQAYYTRLQFTIQAFQIVALVNIESYQHAGHNARQKDQQNLNRTLAQLQADNDRLADLLKRGTGRAGGEDREAILTTMQQRLNRGQGDDAELQFYRKTIQQLPADERNRRPVEVPRWTISQFDVEREVAIGTGGYGTVYRGTWRKQAVAIKVMKTKENVYPNPGVVRNEITIWESLDHPNIIKFLGANILDDEPFIVMPLAKYGNAKAYLEATPGCNRTKLMRDVVCGLAYLHHDKRIVHGDIKAVNILIDQVEGEPTRALLCDFGLASIKYDIETRSSVNPNSLVGTRNYMAPEMFKGVPPRFPGDIYALGMTMYEIFTGEVPLGYIGADLLLKLVVEQNTRPERPTAVEAPQMTDDLWTLITQCWSRAPADRPTATQVHGTLKTMAGMTRRRENGSVNYARPARRAHSPSDPGRSRTPRSQGGYSGTPGLGHDMLSNLMAARSITPSFPTPAPSFPTPNPSPPAPPPVLNIPEPHVPPRTKARASPSPGRRPSDDQELVESPTILSSSSSLSPGNSRSRSLRPSSAPSLERSRSSTSLSASPVPHFLEALVRATTIGFPMSRPWRTCFVLRNPALVSCVSLSPNGDALVAGLASGHFEMWNPRKGIKTSPQSESGSEGRPNISPSPIIASSVLKGSNSSFALGLANGVIAQHHTDLEVSVRRFDNKDRVRCICLTSGGEGGTDEVLVFNRAGEIVIWPMSLDEADAELSPQVIRVPELRGDLVAVNRASFSPDGSLLFAGMANGYLYIIDTSTGRLIREPLPYGDAPPSPAQPPSLFDVLTSPNGVAPPPRPQADWVQCKSLTPSPDGRKVLVGYSTGEIRLWDVRNGSRIIMRNALSGNAPKILYRSISLAFSPDGSKIAYPSLQAEKTVEIQDVLSKRIEATVQLQYDAARAQEGLPPCPDRRIQTLDLTRDNKMLVVSFEKSADVMVWVWQ